MIQNSAIQSLQTITTWLDNVIKVRDKNIALVEGEEIITYFEFGKKISQYAEVFTSLEIKKRQTVILQMGNIKECIYALFGLIRIGAIPVVVNPLLGTYEVERIVDETNPAAYVYYSDNSNSSLKILKKIKEEYTNVMILSTEEINNLVKEKNFKDNYYQADVEDVAFLMLSGGTTGRPKLVPITHKMIFYHLSSYCRKFALNSDDSYLAILPLAHKMGLYSPGAINFLFTGGKVVLCKEGSCDEWLSLIESKQITVMSLVPTLASVLIDFLQYDNSYNLSTLKGVYIGGSIISSEVITNLLRLLKCNIQIIYGATEGIAMYSSYSDDSKKISNSYQHVLNGEENIRVIDEHGNDVGENQKGELIVKGPYTIKSYFDLKDNTPKRFTQDGYYRTGDICVYSKEYGYKILGRIVDRINRGGEKIDPIEVEEMITNFPNVEAAVSIGVEDEFLGEKHCLFIKTSNKNIRIKNIRMFLDAQGLARYKFPDKLIILDEIPLTKVNKIDRKRLREIAKRQ